MKAAAQKLGGLFFGLRRFQVLSEIVLQAGPLSPGEDQIRLWILKPGGTRFTHRLRLRRRTLFVKAITVEPHPSRGSGSAETQRHGDYATAQCCYQNQTYEIHRQVSAYKYSMHLC
jgi:hypothetical protein